MAFTPITFSLSVHISRYYRVRHRSRARRGSFTIAVEQSMSRVCQESLMNQKKERKIRSRRPIADDKNNKHNARGEEKKPIDLLLFYQKQFTNRFHFTEALPVRQQRALISRRVRTRVVFINTLRRSKGLYYI